MQRLFDACYAGDEKKVKKQLKQINHRTVPMYGCDEQGMTVFHVSVLVGKESVFSLLLGDLQKRAESCSSNDASRCLVQAAFLTTDDEEQAPVHLAIRNKQNSMTRWMLDMLTYWPDVLDKVLCCRDIRGYTPLLTAIASQNHEILQPLCMHSAQISSPSPTIADNEGRGLLMHCLLQGDVEALRILRRACSSSVDPNQHDNKGVSPLFYLIDALKNASGDTTADKRSSDDPRTRDSSSVQQFQSPSLHLLLLQELLGFTCLNVNTTRGSTGRTSLWTACERNLPRAVEMLLKCSPWPGVDVNRADSRMSMTPLHVAINGNHHECANLLIMHPATNVDALDANSMTPLYVAVCRDNTHLAGLLLHRRRADPNITAVGGHSALYTAVCLDHRESVKMLLQAGARVEMSDQLGHSVFHAAADRNRHECLKILFHAGAKQASPRSDESAEKGEDAPAHPTACMSPSAIYSPPPPPHSTESAPTALAAVAAKQRDKDGSMPLTLAAFRDHVESVKTLLTFSRPSEEDLLCQNTHGYTPLSVTVDLGHVRSLFEMLDYCMANKMTAALRHVLECCSESRLDVLVHVLTHRRPAFSAEDILTILKENCMRHPSKGRLETASMSTVSFLLAQVAGDRRSPSCVAALSDILHAVLTLNKRVSDMRTCIDMSPVAIAVARAMGDSDGAATALAEAIHAGLKLQKNRSAKAAKNRTWQQVLVECGTVGGVCHLPTSSYLALSRSLIQIGNRPLAETALKKLADVVAADGADRQPPVVGASSSRMEGARPQSDSICLEAALVAIDPLCRFDMAIMLLHYHSLGRPMGLMRQTAAIGRVLEAAVRCYSSAKDRVVIDDFVCSVASANWSIFAARTPTDRALASKEEHGFASRFQSLAAVIIRKLVVQHRFSCVLSLLEKFMAGTESVPADSLLFLATLFANEYIVPVSGDNIFHECVRHDRFEFLSSLLSVLFRLQSALNDILTASSSPSKSDGNKPPVSLLLQFRHLAADLAARRNSLLQESPLHVCCRKQNARALLSLLDVFTFQTSRTATESPSMEAALFLQDAQGNTPLQVAVLHNWPEGARICLRSLSEDTASRLLAVRNRDGRTALGHAVSLGHQSMYDLLSSYCDSTGVFAQGRHHDAVADIEAMAVAPKAVRVDRSPSAAGVQQLLVKGGSLCKEDADTDVVLAVANRSTAHAVEAWEERLAEIEIPRCPSISIGDNGEEDGSQTVLERPLVDAPAVVLLDKAAGVCAAGGSLKEQRGSLLLRPCSPSTSPSQRFCPPLPDKKAALSRKMRPARVLERI